MKALRIYLSSKSTRELKGKREEAQKLNDLQVFKKITAILAFSEQMSVCEIAELLDVSGQSVRVWIGDFLHRSMESFSRIKSKGRPSKLSKKNKSELEKIIEEGAQKAGYPGQCWRSPMIQDFIFRKFKVFYSVFYSAELLKNMGFSFQKAQFESAHLNEIKRKEWIWKRWPELLKKAKKLGAYIFFGDEASFPQWGTLNYTWAKKGATPLVKTSGSRKGYKVFGLIEYFSGKFFCQAPEEKLNSNSYIHFLEGVLEKTKKHLFLIQDNAGYHTSDEVKQFFDDHSERLSIVELPAYSPDYNPIELLWKKIKEKGTHLHYFPTFEALKVKVDFMLGLFEHECKEVLKLFGFYHELSERSA